MRSCDAITVAMRSWMASRRTAGSMYRSSLPGGVARGRRAMRRSNESRPILLAPFFEGDALAELLPAIVNEALELSGPAQVGPRRSRSASPVLELFHGPTAAFKDFGARFLAACLARMPRPDSPSADDTCCDLGRHGRCGRRSLSSAARISRRAALPLRQGFADAAAATDLLGRQCPEPCGARHVR